MWHGNTNVMAALPNIGVSNSSSLS